MGGNFDPVSSLADLATLDHTEIVEGYASAERGDPEPGLNRGRAYWHGWRNAMMDMGEIEIDDASRQLAHEYYHDLLTKNARPPTCGKKRGRNT